nr:hypothetical protein CFP56_33757 [Quercus suber]
MGKPMSGFVYLKDVLVQIDVHMPIPLTVGCLVPNAALQFNMTSCLFYAPVRLDSLLDLQTLGRLQPTEHKPADRNHAGTTDHIRCVAAGPPVQCAENQRAKGTPDLAETAMVTELLATLRAPGLETRKAVKTRDDGAARDREQRCRGVQPALGRQARKQEERTGGAGDAELYHTERVHASRHAALQQTGNKPNEAKQLAGLLGTKVRIRALALGRSSGFFRGGRRGFGGRISLGKRVVEVKCLGDNQGKGNACSCGEWIGCDGRDVRKSRSERWTKRKGDAEADAHHSHGLATILVAANVRCNREGELHISFAQPSHDSTGEKCSEICGRAPQCHRGNVAAHRPQECGPPSVLVRHGTNDRRRDCLAQGEERAEGSSEQHDVITVVDGLFEAVLVGVQAVEHAGKYSVVIGRFKVSIELEELGEER